MDTALVSRRQSIPGKERGSAPAPEHWGIHYTLPGYPNMGKIPQNINFSASISKTFTGGQKWMVVTGLSGGVLLKQSL